MRTTTNSRCTLILATAALVAAVAAPGGAAKARPEPGAGPATGCSALTSNPNAKGGSAPTKLDCASTALPDLWVGGSCDRPTLPSQEQATCTVDIHNGGTGAAVLPVGMLLVHFAYPVGFTLNTYTVPGSSSDWSCTFGGAFSEQTICQVAVEQTLAPGGTLTFRVTGIAPLVSCIDTARSGNFVATADLNGTLAESNETNNALTIAMSVTPANC
jgi:hypothetical protein